MLESVLYPIGITVYNNYQKFNTFSTYLCNSKYIISSLAYSKTNILTYTNMYKKPRLNWCQQQLFYELSTMPFHCKHDDKNHVPKHYCPNEGEKL